MAKKKGRRRAKEFTLPLAVIAGFVPAGLDVGHAIKDHGILAGMDHVSLCTTGITSKPDGTTEFHPGYAAFKLWIPLLLGILVHKIAGKLGVNRMLGTVGVPVLRI